MRKVAAWGLAAIMAVGQGAAVVGAAEDEAGGTSAPSARASTWHWRPIIGGFGSKEEKKATDKKPLPTSGHTPAKKPIAPASVLDEAAAERGREEAALLRRLQACDKLKEMALRTNDNDLLRLAEQLEERAQKVYAHRTARLAGGAGSFESDETTVNYYRGAGKSRSVATSPYTVSGNDHRSRSAATEDKP